MKTPAIFSNLILKKLSYCNIRGCTLENLTEYVIPYSDRSAAFSEYISSKRKNQAKILEVLLQLEHKGYIFLNPYTDLSMITIKGLIKINNTALYN